jgi:spermidine/putrescine transport system permease protein
MVSRKTSQVLRKISTPILLVPAVAITIVFLLAGLVYGVIASLTPAGAFSLENYVSVFRDYSLVLRDTLLMSAGTTALLVAISLPIAYFLAVRVQSDALKLVALLVMLVPFWTDWNIRMISWYPVLSGSGLINQIYLWVMRTLGYGNVEPLKILFQNSGVLITWIQSYILFMIVPIYLGLLRMDPKILKAAATLGANRMQVFYPTMGMVIFLTAAWGINFSLAMAMSVVILVAIGAVVGAMLKLVNVTRVMY